MKVYLVTGFEVEHNRFDNDLCVSFKSKGCLTDR